MIASRRQLEIRDLCRLTKRVDDAKQAFGIADQIIDLSSESRDGSYPVPRFAPEFGYIAPTKFLGYVPESSTFHLCLAHLCTDKDYCEFYREKRLRGDLIIMDNSAFEFNGSLDSRQLMDLIESSGINPDVVVSPDYPGAPATKTLDAFDKFASLIRDEYGSKYRIMAVPQSEVGNFDEWLVCYRSLAANADFIGMSILGIPNAACRITGTKDISYNRLYVTQWLIRHGFVNMSGTGPWHHYLGAGSPSEIRLQRQLGLMNSMDSSSPIWHGINGIKYDDSASGLIGGKIKRHVDFSLSPDDDECCGNLLAISQAVRHNIEYVQNSLA